MLAHIPQGDFRWSYPSVVMQHDVFAARRDELRTAVSNTHACSIVGIVGTVQSRSLEDTTSTQRRFVSTVQLSPLLAQHTVTFAAPHGESSMYVR